MVASAFAADMQTQPATDVADVADVPGRDLNLPCLDMHLLMSRNMRQITRDEKIIPIITSTQMYWRKRDMVAAENQKKWLKRRQIMEEKGKKTELH